MTYICIESIKGMKETILDNLQNFFVVKRMSARKFQPIYYKYLVFSFNFLIQFFFLSGLNTEIALRKAKENVEKHYAVVGVLEELNKTLTVLEHYIPRYFKGAKDVYWSKSQNSKLEKHQKLILFF